MEKFLLDIPDLWLASTGPRPRGRGMEYFGSFAPTLKMLQRGRARAGAECKSDAKIGEFVDSCFNGAAPARARNETDLICALRFSDMGFNGAAPARARNVPC